MEVILIIGGVVILFLVARTLMTRKTQETRRHTDDELRSMSDDEWETIARKGFRDTDTSVLKIYARQYTDLRQRIESGHKQTLETLDEQGRRRSLRSGELVAEELSRRGVSV
tara:strand:- start:2203 stop:2538 length:336 start_codon:yes stop_codon:yes gene_type:complete